MFIIWLKFKYKCLFENLLNVSMVNRYENNYKCNTIAIIIVKTIEFHMHCLVNNRLN